MRELNIGTCVHVAWKVTICGDFGSQMSLPAVKAFSLHAALLKTKQIPISKLLQSNVSVGMTTPLCRPLPADQPSVGHRAISSDPDRDRAESAGAEPYFGLRPRLILAMIARRRAKMEEFSNRHWYNPYSHGRAWLNGGRGGGGKGLRGWR